MARLLDCPAADAWLTLLSESAPLDDRRLYDEHLETCAICQERLDLASEIEGAILSVGRRVGDPTLVPVDPKLNRFLEVLREKPFAAEFANRGSIDLHFLRRSDQTGILGLIGDYLIEEVIGQGGMGIVLKAYEPALHRRVAIKVMAVEIAGSASSRRRFTREARLASSVCHDHVVTVHAVAEQAGLPYLVMQYVAGESLQSRIDREGPLIPVDIVRIAMQTASGLAAAHAQGLIHRDIKPANLLLASPPSEVPNSHESHGIYMSHGTHAKEDRGVARVGWHVKITDFGLARLAEDIGLTKSGVVAGTPEYMAPEQARGEPIDHRCDLFSLGSVLYAMSTGRRPFRADSSYGVLRLVSDTEPCPIKEINPEIPAWLCAIVSKLMAKRPDDRFATAGEVAELLQDCLAHLQQPANFPLPSCLSKPQAAAAPRLRKPLKKGVVIMVVALGLVLAGLLGPQVLIPPDADGNKDNPAAKEKKGNAPARVPVPQKNVPATPEQMRAIAILKRLNAKFKFDAPGQPVVHVSFEPGTAVDDVLEDLLPLTEIGVLGLQGTTISDAGLKHVAGFKKMHQLYLGQTAVTDAGLKELATLKRLTHLGLENTRVSDAGINSIASLKNLNYLNIGATAITDGCLKDIGGFHQLGMLCLYSTEVTDAGMKELKGLTNLRTLLLNDTALTDAGINELATLKDLKKIVAQNTKITDAGLRALKEAVPAAAVEADPSAELGGQAWRFRGWLTAAGVVAGLIALTAAGVVLVVGRRQKGGKIPPSLDQVQKETSSPAVTLPITLQCPKCQRTLRVKAEHAGKAVKCPSCGSAVEVPSLIAGLPPVKPAPLNS